MSSNSMLESNVSHEDIRRGMVECFVSQCRNASPMIHVDTEYHGLFLEIRLTFAGVLKRILALGLPNIVLLLDENKTAVWEYVNANGEPDVSEFDAVALFFGEEWSAIPGAIARESTGNKYKDDYRRLGRTCELTKHPSRPCAWYEVRTILSEENIIRLFMSDDVPMVYVGDSR